MHQTTVLKYTFKWIASFSSKQTKKKQNMKHYLWYPQSSSRVHFSVSIQLQQTVRLELLCQSLYLQDWPYSASAVRFVLKNVVII